MRDVKTKGVGGMLIVRVSMCMKKLYGVSHKKISFGNFSIIKTA